MARPAEALAPDPVPVVLLGRDDAQRAQLRGALNEFGANILHEGDAGSADCAQIIALRPSVVLLNLEPGEEDVLDALDPLFAEPSINVVFNEAEASSQLVGWDLARWARHLAAKVLGLKDNVPPPPAGSEALPDRNFQPEPGAPQTPEQEVGDVTLDGFTDEAANSEHGVPSSRDLSAPDEPPSAVLDTSSTSMATDIRTVPTASLAPDHAEPQSVELELERDELPVELKRVELDHDLHGATQVGDEAPISVAVDREVHGGQPNSDDFSLDLGAIESSLSELDASRHAAVGSSQRLAAHADGAGSADFGLELDFDHADATPSGVLDDDDAELDLSLDPDVAALTAQLEAMEGQPSAVSMELDFDFSKSTTEAATAQPEVESDSAEPPAIESVSEVAAAEPPAEAEVVEPHGVSSFSELSLAAIDDDDAPAQPADAAPTAAAAAPKQADSYDFSNLSLSLAPIDDAEAEAPQVAGELPASPSTHPAPISAVADASSPAADAAVDELSLDGFGDTTDAAAVDGGLKIPRVLVLGASIGGPDALRTFLTHLPENFPAVLLLCQHLDNGFFSRLAQQLQKVSKLPVRVAVPDGEPARIGEVLMVPSSHRFQIDEDGRIEVSEHVQPPRYKPCIDDLMCDMADRFGSRVTAIVFSGMAGDAVEGAVHVTERGGEVWVQDPDSCVVSSMVDGARARGVVEFIGSPRELAERCVQKYGRPG